MKKLLLLLFLSIGTLFSEQGSDLFIRKSLEELVKCKKLSDGALYKKYLYKGELNGYVVAKFFIPSMTPLEINDALRDIRTFIEGFIATAVKNVPEKVGESFLTEVLHAYGHVITAIENAWVNRQTGRVIVTKKGETVDNADSLVDYWWSLERFEGVKLHSHKFYASCLDYLNIMVKGYMLFPCYDCHQWEEMEDRWFRWLEKVTAKLHENQTFGGYYQESIRLFREVFALWREDFEKKQQRPSSYTAE